MSSRFAISDFLALPELCSKIQADFADRPLQFLGTISDSVPDRIESLRNVLDDTIRLFSRSNLVEGYEIAFRNIGNRIHDVLENIQHPPQKCYNSLQETKLDHSFSPYQSQIIKEAYTRILFLTLELDALKKGFDQHHSDSMLHSGFFIEESDLEHRKILEWLTPIAYSTQLEYCTSLLVPRTGQWLLDSKGYREWVATKTRTLFCPGIPGVGKTVLSSIIVKNLQKVFSTDHTVGICYIFLDSRQRDVQNLEHVISSFLKQLLHGRNSIPDLLKELYDRYKETQNKPSMDELSKAFYSVAADYSRVFIIIDALDEYDSSHCCRSRFISELKDLQSSLKASILITSRFLPDIMTYFHDAELLEIRATEEDISSYIEHRFIHSKNLKLLDLYLAMEVKQSVLKYSDGIFLLARSYLNSFDGKYSPMVIREVFDRFARGPEILDETYKDIMSQIHGQSSVHRDLSLRVLLWTLYTKRPLTLVELQHAFSIKLDEPGIQDNLVVLPDLPSLCHGLVKIDKNTNAVRLSHHTIEQYFQRNKTAWFEDGDKSITETCVAYLTLDTFNSGMCSSDSEFSQRLLLYPLFNYASTYWGVHAYSIPNCQYHHELLTAPFKVEAATQGLLMGDLSLETLEISQKVPSGLTALHLVALFGLQEAMRKLLEDQKSDVMDSSNRTPLSYAAGKGHESVVQLLLNKNADPYLRDAYKRMPLSYAAENGHESIVQRLLVTNAESNLKEQSMRMALSYAIKKGHDGVIKLLIHMINDSCAEDQGEGVQSFEAAESCHMAIVRLLSSNGASRSQLEGYIAAKLTSLAHEDQETDIVSLIEAAPYVSVDHKFCSWLLEGRKLDIMTLVLKRGCWSIFGNQDKQDILRLAIETSHETLTKLLLDHDPALRSLIGNSRTNLIFFAVECGQTSIVNLLLRYSIIDVNMRNEEGFTMLLLAAFKKDIAMVNMLLSAEGVKADLGDSTGRTLLSIMAEAGEVPVVKQLIERSDVNLNSKDNKGRTPLSWAAARGHNEVVRLLTQSGIVGVNTEDENGWTPLFWASEGAHEGVVAQLLEVKANGLKEDQRGRTALHCAAKHKNKSLVKTLLPHVKPDVCDRNNQTALLIALETGNRKVLKCLMGSVDASLCLLIKDNRKEPLEALLNMGCDINSTDHQGRSLVYLAVVHKAIPMLHFLITKKADVNKKCTDGTTPIQYAIHQQASELVRILLQAGSKMSGISAKEWKSAFKEPENAVLILEATEVTESYNQRHSISFIKSNNWSDWPIPSEEPRKRSICVLKHIPRWLKSPSASQSTIIYHKIRDSTENIHCVEARFSVGVGSKWNIFKNQGFMIAWTLHKTSPNSAKSWVTMDHITNLPLGSLPKDGLDFFQVLLDHTTDEWLGICLRADHHFIALRRKVFESKGRSIRLLDELLETATLLASLLEQLNLHVKSAAGFSDYCTTVQEDYIGTCQEKILKFNQTVRQRVVELEERLQSLIQVEFNLVSINEARQSTTVSASMKRLSWINFIFLPLMFASSLFGMNVNILAANPDWRWFLLTGVLSLVLTFLGWVIFKYFHLESWIQYHVGARIEDRACRWKESAGKSIR